MAFILGTKVVNFSAFTSPDQSLTTANQQVLSWYIGEAGGGTLLYNSVSLTKLLDAQIGATGVYYELWLTGAFFSAAPATLDWSFAPSFGWFCTYPLTGVKNVTTVSSPVTGQTGTVTTFSIVVTGLQPGWLAVCGIETQGWVAAPSACTVGGANALDYAITIASGTGRAGGLAHWISTGTSVQFDWTVASDSYKYWGAGFPADDIGAVVWMFFKKYQKFLRDLKAGLIPRDLLRQRYQEVYAI